METGDTTNLTNVKMPPAYRAMIATSVVAAVISLIILGILFGGWYQMKVVYPKRELALAEMKTASVQNPKDTALADQVRQLDLQLRQTRFRRLDMVKKAGWILLGTLTVCMLCLKWAMNIAKKLPMPGQQPDQSEEQIRRAVFSGRAVTVGLLVIGMSWAVAFLWPVVDFTAQDANANTGFPTTEEVRANWPSFRGPQGLGISAYTNIPTEWNVETGQNIAWKTPIDDPGSLQTLPGFNSPIVWEDKIFFSGATQEKREVYCFDLATGKHLWTANIPSLANLPEPLEIMRDTGYAACSMATDGRRVFAIFPTGDIGAVDFKGKLVWNKNLGVPDSVYGYASSLAMYQDKVIVLFDQAFDDDDNARSKILALDSFTGQIKWQTPRQVRGSWGSPTVVETPSGFQILTCADPWVIAYNPEDGTEIWKTDCLGGDVAPSPIYADGKAYVITVYESVQAIATNGTGNVTKTHVKLVGEDEIPDITSPVANEKFLWMLTTEGILTCWDVAGPLDTWPEEKERMLWDYEFEKESFFASPTLVGDKIYSLSEKGVMHIVAADAEFKALAKNDFGDKCLASPAFVDGTMIVRSEQYLWCIKGGSQ